MSIDKNSTGFPEVNTHRPTTKVNLWMIAGMVIFLAVAAAVAIWESRRAAFADGSPPPAMGKN
jgi:hypothetical protein